jgi:hypothetical protein
MMRCTEPGASISLLPASILPLAIKHSNSNSPSIRFIIITLPPFLNPVETLAISTSHQVIVIAMPAVTLLFHS